MRSESCSSDFLAAGRGTWCELNEPSIYSPSSFFGAPQPYRVNDATEVSESFERSPSLSYLDRTENEDRPTRLYDRVATPSGLLYLMNLGDGPFHGCGKIQVDIFQVLNEADLVSVTAVHESQKYGDRTKIAIGANLKRATSSLSSIVP